MKRQELEDKFKAAVQNAARTTTRRYSVRALVGGCGRKIVVFDLEQLRELARLFRMANRDGVDDEGI